MAEKSKGKAKKKFSVFDFIGESPGSGLFISEQARQQGEQVYIRVYKFLDSLPKKYNGKDWEGVSENLRNRLIEISAAYYADCDHDRRINRPEIRSNVKVVRESAVSIQSVLENLDLSTRQTIQKRAIADLRRHGLAPNDITQYLIDTIQSIIPALNAIVAERNRRVGECALGNVCKRSRKLWKDITGKKFSRNYLIYQLKTDKSESAHLRDFVKSEHQFVHLIAYCLNNQIGSAQVRSSLMIADRQRSK